MLILIPLNNRGIFFRQRILNKGVIKIKTLNYDVTLKNISFYDKIMLIKTDSITHKLNFNMYNLIEIIYRLNKTLSYCGNLTKHSIRVESYYSSKFILLYEMSRRKYSKELNEEYCRPTISLAIKMTKYILRLYNKIKNINNKKEYVLYNTKNKKYIKIARKNIKYDDVPKTYNIINAYFIKNNYLYHGEKKGVLKIKKWL